MKKKMKYLIAGSVAVVLAGSGIVYMMQPDSVETAIVTRQDVTQYVKGTGTISADETITVYAPVAGKLSEVSYKEGDTVGSGDLLAEYDLVSYTNAYQLAVANEDYYTDSYDAAVKENNKEQSRYDQAAANADALKQQYAQTQSEMDAIDKAQAKEYEYIGITMQKIESSIGNMETELADHQAKSAEAGSEKSILEAQMAMLQGQSDEYKIQITALETAGRDTSQLVAEKELIDAQIAPLQDKINKLNKSVSDENKEIESLINRISEKRKALTSLPIEGMTADEYATYAALSQRLDLIDREWSENLSTKEIAGEKILNDSQIAQYQDSAEIARLQTESAEYYLHQAEAGVKSECSGVILERLVNTGASVEAGQELYVIQPTEGYKVTIMISKYDIEKISVGQTAEIVQGTTVFKGEVSRIYPVAETDASGKPKVKVDVLIKDSSAVPIIGLETEVSIDAGSSVQTLAVPKEAVYTDDRGDYVYILENQKAEKRYVTVGRKGIDQVEILYGLNENDHVITTIMTDDNVGTKYREA
ncbi:MAG: HlyD family efflux transporter periplasmic adaptor subunit [Lachnospiraceae bacterium]